MNPLIGFLVLILSQLMIAVSLVCNKILLIHMSLSSMLGCRFLIASLIGLPILLMNYQRIKGLQLNDWLKLLVQAILGGFLFNLFMYAGLNYTSASYAGLMSSTLPFMILILSFFLLKEILNIYQVSAIFIASIGMILIHYQPFDEIHLSSHYLGSLLIFLALFSDSIYFIYSKRYPLPIPSLLASILIIFLNSLIFIPGMFLYSFSISNLEPQLFGLLFLMSLSIILFYLFWLSASKHVSGFSIALATAFGPLATLSLSAYFLGESISKTSIFGMLLIMLALVLQVYSGSRFSKWRWLNKINHKQSDIEDKEF
jgi:drug/metabolite transporter (DMT)-like permease